jgi:hypothetical protein
MFNFDHVGKRRWSGMAKPCFTKKDSSQIGKEQSSESSISPHDESGSNDCVLGQMVKYNLPNEPGRRIWTWRTWETLQRNWGQKRKQNFPS